MDRPKGCPGTNLDNPASSCLQIEQCDSDLPLGFYWTTITTQFYCDMDRPKGCPGINNPDNPASSCLQIEQCDPNFPRASTGPPLPPRSTVTLITSTLVPNGITRPLPASRLQSVALSSPRACTGTPPPPRSTVTWTGSALIIRCALVSPPASRLHSISLVSPRATIRD